MRDPKLYLMAASMLGYMGGYTISTTWIYAYLQDQYEIPLAVIGTIASVAIFVPAIPGSLASGWLSDRLGSRVKVAGAGALVAALSLLLLTLRFPLYIMIFVLMIYGSFALFHTPIFSMPAEIWSVEVSGTALSIVTCVSQVGAAVTSALSGYMLLDKNNYQPVWIFGSATYLGAAVAILLIRDKPRQHK